MDWSNLPSLSALRAFEAAARQRSFSGAARELNVTHAAIAQHVRRLEADLDVPLILREGRGVAPTDAGRKLAEQLLQGFETIAAGVRELRVDSEARPLQITATPAFAAHWLMPRLGSFWQAHPEVTLNINPGSNLVDLRRDGFDLGIRFGEGTWPKLTSELLTHGDFWVVAHPDLLQAHDACCWEDTARLPWLMEASMLERRRVVEDAGLCLDDTHLTLLETNQLVLSATQAALGVSVHPKALVEREVAFGQLLRICELKQENLGYFMVTLPDRQSKGLKLFKSWLRKTAREARSQ